MNSFINDSKLAAYSFFPRPDWWFTIKGKRVRPMGSYCLILNRDIVAKERYFLKPFSYEYHLRHNIKSFYIAVKIHCIYKMIFNEESCMPVFTEEELYGFLESVPESDLKNGIVKDFKWVDESHQKILFVLNKSNQQNPAD